MEKEITQHNNHPVRSSSAVNTGIPTEKRRAMGDVLDRWRLNQGWRPYDEITQSAAIQSWVAELDTEAVPYTAYAELYSRALTIRALAIQAGKQIPNFGVELLLAGWIGEDGLQREWAARIREQMVSEGRTLGDPHRGMVSSPILSGKEGMQIVRDYLATLKAEKESKWNGS